MSEAKVHVSVEQRIIIKFLTKEGCKPSEICSRLKRQYGEKTLSNVSVYKWRSAFKKGRETVENEPNERRPRTSIIGENSDRVDTIIREKRRINVHELSGILNISDGSGKTISKDSHQEQEKKVTNISVISPG
jgi:transposase